MKSNSNKKRGGRPTAPDRVALAELKVHLSRYVREVQEGGRAITITQHGRDTAVLAPVKAAEARPQLRTRPPLDPRPLDEFIKALKPLPGGEQPSEKDIQEALDWARADRF